MRLSKITLFAICTLLFGVLQQTTTNAQSSADYQIHLKNQVLSPEENVDAFISTFDQKNEAFIQDHFFKIVQFNEVPDASVKEILSEAGITLLDYLPVNAYFAAFSNDFNIEILNKADIRSIIDVENSYKLSPMLYEEGYPDYALRPDDKIELLLNYYHVIASSTVVDRIQKYGYEVMLVDHFAHYLHIVIPVSAIDKIAGEACVMYMEPIYPVPEPENYTGRTLHHGNSIASDYSTGRHYDGTGVHIIIQDDGRIGPHIDYEGRIGGQFMGFNSGSHGDHCAGIIMGSGNKDPKGRGNAFGSTLYVYPAAGYEGFSSIPLTYNSYDIRITSTSYGDGCNAGYTTLSRSLDQQSRIYHSLMHVFSTGNSGTSDCGYGAGPGWGNITGGHKAGKNVIAVANLDYIDNLAGSSSRGPAHDGRIKPDLAAKGSSVYSTINPNIYDIYSGTSMACPGTAGTLAQLYQAYREIVGGEPGGGLMKALLLNTAEDLGNPGPDFKFGWGRINALRAVKVIEENRFDTSFIAHGGTKTHVFDVPENTAQMRVMVYWTDFEASVNTNWALVNNLDITVEDPQSSTWNPWVLNHFPHADSLNKNAVRGTDDRNNVEQVTLDYPEAGSYTLMVTGTTIPYGPQVYYIVYEFIPEGVILIYPFGGESFAPGEEETIRWDAFGYDEPFQLEYSLDNGTSWIVISDSLDGAARHYDWDVPITVSGQGLIKITRGNTDSQNEVPFSVMGVPQNVTIDWACSEALHLSWEPVVGAVEYEVMMLGEKYMEPLATTGVTSYIVDDISISQEYWFTVRAIGENGAQGQRAIAVQKSPGTFDCHEVDAMIESVPFADWGVFQSCMDISDLSISVKIKNFGLEPIENPDLSFQLDGGAVVTETCSMIIAPDSTYYYDFDEQIDISEIGNHILKVWIDYAPDQNPDNDLLEISLEVIEG
nr:S8 family serine peptidase [Bacteroidota bacterium]